MSFLRWPVFVGSLLLLVGCASHELAPPPQATYLLDGERSTVTFTIDHNGRPLTGKFRTTNGAYTPASAEASGTIYAAVAAGSIDTANGLRDAHLRTGDFFHVSQHPAVTFSGEVQPGEDVGTLLARGTLTMLGVEQPLTVTLTPLPGVADGPAHRCTFSVERSAFGLTNGLANGSIGDLVELTVELQWISSEPSTNAQANTSRPKLDGS
ncbi:MAG: YceI family protein [Planctomycetota bacterium]